EKKNRLGSLIEYPLGPHHLSSPAKESQI
ncbi:hypothetical protein SOVF_009600, partial [Spinacia oleracea]